MGSRKREASDFRRVGSCSLADTHGEGHNHSHPRGWLRMPGRGGKMAVTLFRSENDCSTLSSHSPSSLSCGLARLQGKLGIVVFFFNFQQPRHSDAAIVIQSTDTA